MEELGVSSLPGGLASVRKQFETQETASSHNVTQFHFHHRTVQVHITQNKALLYFHQADTKSMKAMPMIKSLEHFLWPELFPFSICITAWGTLQVKIQNSDWMLTVRLLVSLVARVPKCVGLSYRHCLTFLTASMKTSRAFSLML